MYKKRLKRALAILMALVLFVSAGPGTVKAASIKLNKKKVSITVGKKTTLKVKNTKKKVIWSSSKKSVATVSKSGRVTAKKRGTAKITAKVGKKKLICKVTVKAKKATSTTTQAPTTDSVQASEMEKVVSLVNKERKAQGLEAVVMDEKLQKAANARAKELVEAFSHTRPNGESCFSIFKTYDITYRACGENIAAGQKDAAAVMNSWMHSEGHRKNILTSSYGKIGVGLYRKPGTQYEYYWVQMFTN